MDFLCRRLWGLCSNFCIGQYPSVDINQALEGPVDSGDWATFHWKNPPLGRFQWMSPHTVAHFSRNVPPWPASENTYFSLQHYGKSIMRSGPLSLALRAWNADWTPSSVWRQRRTPLSPSGDGLVRCVLKCFRRIGGVPGSVSNGDPVCGSPATSHKFLPQ